MARFGSLDLKCRPIRLGFLVEPGNAGQVRAAIRLASTLWGGAYCPIIPVYKRLPADWRDRKGERWTAKSVVTGYLQAFDPDALVSFSKSVPAFIKNAGVEVLSPEVVWDDEAGRKVWSPRHGIGVFELLNEVYARHFKYRAKYPVRVVLPQLPKARQPFWTAVFGELPDSILPRVREHFTEPVEIIDVEVTESNFTEFLFSTDVFPRRLTQAFLEHRSRGWRESYAFFMDAASVGDVIDYWNLRALGKDVFPFPRHLGNDETFRKGLERFLRATRRPFPNDPTHSRFASILRSDRSTIDQMEAFAKTFTVATNPDDPSKSPFFSLQHWYPRLWDEWARDKDSASPDDFYEQELSVDINGGDADRLSWKPLLPTFSEKYALHGGLKCANEIGIRLYGRREHGAEAFPRASGANYLRAVSGRFSRHDDWRVGRNGLVHLIRHPSSEMLEIPSGERVFFAWLQDQGWIPELSPPGRLAKQIHAQLSGWTRVLGDEKLLALLERMNGGRVKPDGRPGIEGEDPVGGPRALEPGEVVKRLKDGQRDASSYLIENGVFHLGLRVQCPHCVRHAWHSVEEIDGFLRCPKCLKTFPSIGHAERGIWQYKTAGPFSVPGYAEGAYATLLALDFFDEMRLGRLRTTRSMSFTASGPGKPSLEADFAFLWQHAAWDGHTDGVAFGECKTYGLFEQKDVQRMRNLAKWFPGAVLIFATLRDKLTENEVRSLSRFARVGRKYWKTERPINPVMILTKHELLAPFGPPHCWKELGFESTFRNVDGLLDLCNATQQIHLSLPPWEEDWRKKWDKQRAALLKKQGQQVLTLKAEETAAARGADALPDSDEGIDRGI
jgi:hypothetical protein